MMRPGRGRRAGPWAKRHSRALCQRDGRRGAPGSGPRAGRRPSPRSRQAAGGGGKQRDLQGSGHQARSTFQREHEARGRRTRSSPPTPGRHARGKRQGRAVHRGRRQSAAGAHGGPEGRISGSRKVAGARPPGRRKRERTGPRGPTRSKRGTAAIDTRRRGADAEPRNRGRVGVSPHPLPRGVTHGTFRERVLPFAGSRTCTTGASFRAAPARVTKRRGGGGAAARAQARAAAHAREAAARGRGRARRRPASAQAQSGRSRRELEPRRQRDGKPSALGLATPTPDRGDVHAVTVFTAESDVSGRQKRPSERKAKRAGLAPRTAQNTWAERGEVERRKTNPRRWLRTYGATDTPSESKCPSDLKETLKNAAYQGRQKKKYDI